MWFKKFQKEEWDIRLYRGINLKFESNLYGCGRAMQFAKIQSYVLRLFRTESVFRFIYSCTLISSFLLYMSFTKESRAKQAIQAEIDSKKLFQDERELYKKSQRLNRYNIPTMPVYSMDSFTDFLGNPSAILSAVDFLCDENLPKYLDDQQKGLDTWMPKADRELFEFASKKPKKGAHH